jgi:hypothetical protein
MKFLIKKILKEETERLDVIHIPSLKYFNNDWNFLQEYLESEGNPPYTIEGDLDLYKTNIESLGNLQSVGGYLDLHRTNIESLGNLQYVGGYLNLYGTNVESLGNLQYVGGHLDLRITPISKKYSIKDIVKIINVRGTIFI